MTRYYLCAEMCSGWAERESQHGAGKDSWKVWEWICDGGTDSKWREKRTSTIPVTAAIWVCPDEFPISGIRKLHCEESKRRSGDGAERVPDRKACLWTETPVLSRRVKEETGRTTRYFHPMWMPPFLSQLPKRSVPYRKKLPSHYTNKTKFKPD